MNVNELVVNGDARINGNIYAENLKPSSIGAASADTSTQYFKWGSAGNSARYLTFAKCVTDIGSGNNTATIILSNVGNYGWARQGVFFVHMSTRNGVTMEVRTIVAPSGDVGFGYYSSGTETYFGVSCAGYQGESWGTIMGSTGFTLGKLAAVTTAPTGWTAVTPKAWLDSVGNASASAAGLMSAAHYTKLEGLTDASTSAAGLMTAAMVTKLNGIAEGANKITVDSAMSTTSTNPVQNKVVNTALGNKLSLSGGTMTGALVAQANANYTTAQVRNVTMSTAAPSGGSNGQIHFQYT